MSGKFRRIKSVLSRFVQQLFSPNRPRIDKHTRSIVYATVGARHRAMRTKGRKRRTVVNCVDFEFRMNCSRAWHPTAATRHDFTLLRASNCNALSLSQHFHQFQNGRVRRRIRLRITILCLSSFRRSFSFLDARHFSCFVILWVWNLFTFASSEFSCTLYVIVSHWKQVKRSQSMPHIVLCTNCARVLEQLNFISLSS